MLKLLDQVTTIEFDRWEFHVFRKMLSSLMKNSLLTEGLTENEAKTVESMYDEVEAFVTPETKESATATGRSRFP